MDLKAKLLGRGLPTDTVDLGDDIKVTVRGLSREEVLACPDAETDAREAWFLAKGLVDPDLSEDEATAWRKAAVSGEVNAVLTRIMELSGLLEDSPKRAYKSVRE